MSRTNRKHSRAIERHRRNKGPALLSKVADKKVEDEAATIVSVLYEAATKRHDTSAAGLLVDLAESAEYADNPVFAKARSLAMQWAKEPQVVAMDTTPQLVTTRSPALLTSGSAPEAAGNIQDAELEEQDVEVFPATGPATATPSLASGGSSGAKAPEILEGEYEMVSGLPTRR
ncbi:MAG TPA: hypothetical protein VG456_06215 [Candidatus Sulfopaludibacter sp.]|jgi:hypothetical protein|nr:hypothetical protein [Candidatus Sulfopaludibacter sp.]